MKRVLLVAAKTGYQVREFHSAADRIGVELVLATDRCHVLDDPWADQATPIEFARPEPGIAALEQRGPFDGILAVGDAPAYVAAQAAERLGLRFHPAEAVRAANDKFLTRERFRATGLNVPEYRLSGEPSRYPCVVKPLHSSASRGVMRADNREEFEQASARIRKMTHGGPILVEDFIPGREFALEGLMTRGCLTALALFDKPDPLDGPYFEETIYVTPSRESSQTQRAIVETAQRAASALGLADGPVHVEMRVNSKGVWMLETAARPIGGLCARALRFERFRRADFSPRGASAPLLASEAEASRGLKPALHDTLEQLLLLHALGEDVSRFLLAPGGHGVMMIPIPRSGVFLGAEGIEEAREIAGITEIEVTAKEGQQLQALPEGATYLGFIFSRARSPEQAERALRLAHARLRFNIGQSLPVVT
ncbi:MAG TPA: ATP-grasp domain-containing protein [Bryobacteraceae bacterium]